MRISTVDIWKTVIYRVNTVIANKLKVAYSFSIGIFKLDIGQIKVKVNVRYISTTSVSQAVTGRAMQILLLATIRRKHVGIRLADLYFVLAYSNGQLGNWNGVSPSIFTFLLKSVLA